MQHDWRVNAWASAGREDLQVVSVKLDGQLLDAGSYQLTPTTLTISNAPAKEFKVSASLASMRSGISSSEPCAAAHVRA